MLVRELNQDQIDELKLTYYYDVENNYTTMYEIPNEVIYDYYNDINFVNDDFACTAGVD